MATSTYLDDKGNEITPQKAYLDDNGNPVSASAPPAPPINTPAAPKKEGFWRSAVAPIVGAVKGLDPRPTPEETQQGLTSAYDYAMRPIERIVQSHIDQGKQAVNEFQQAAPLSLHPTADQLAHRQLAVGHGLAAAVPVVGPWAASTGEKIGTQVGTGDISGAVGTGVGNAALALAPKAVGKVVGKLKPAPTEAGQTSALSSVLARTPMSSDKGFIVQDVADAIKDPLRQAAADNPAITEVALGKDPVKAYGAYQALLTKAKQGFEKQFNSVLGPERNYPVDGHAIASQLSSSDALRRMFPNEAEWVDDFYHRLGTVKTLGELDDVRKLLNDRVKSTYKNAAPTMEEGGKVGATRAGLDLMRQYFYFKLEEATGQDLSGLKRTEGAVMDAERAGVANGPQLTAAHQKHVEPTTPARKFAGIIKGGKNVAAGNFALPVAGYVADALEGSNLQQLHAYLKRALSDLPPPTPAQAAPPPAPLPPNRVKLGPGGPGTAIQTTPPGPAPGPRPAPSVTYPNPAGIGAPPPVSRSRGLGSMPPAPQLQSGPAAYAGPNTVNASTARTPIAPTLAERTAVPPEAPPPGTGMVVAPDGTITIPKKMLAAPPKVGTIIEVGGKKMRVVKGKRGQTALEPVKTPAEMSEEYSDPNNR